MAVICCKKLQLILLPMPNNIKACFGEIIKPLRLKQIIDKYSP